VIAYLDTSAFLKLVIDEAGSEQVVELWTSADQVVSSVLLYPEARAALAMARRLERLSSTESRSARAEFEALFADLALISATIPLLRRAGDLAETHALRGYDAVHLASIEAIGDPETVMVTADHQLRTAALDRGLATANLPT
jgi:uncharacterized protein